MAQQQPSYSVNVPALQPPAHPIAAQITAPVRSPAIAAGQVIASTHLGNALVEQEKLRSLQGPFV
jgi:hypothetical protein